MRARGFSALKRIKTTFYNRLSNEITEALLSIATEGPTHDSFNFESAFSVWASCATTQV